MNISQYIHQFAIKTQDLERPWGGFYCIDDKDLVKFITQYFSDITVDTQFPISPKILIINPGKRLSWQYHNRRSEIWKILEGPVGIIRSDNDNEGQIQYMNKGDIVVIHNKERHRLVGLNTSAIVAELWCHTDTSNLSNEQDIIRVQDDFRR
jgi:mannose-6-phosphate isomerase